MKTPKKEKKIKIYIVCFALNKKCLQGDIRAFSKLKEAKQYIVDLHKKIGGFKEDHHIVKGFIDNNLTLSNVRDVRLNI